MARAGECGKLGLQRAHLRPLNELAMGEHASNGIVDRTSTAAALRRHVDEGNRRLVKARNIHVATRDKYLIADLLTLQVTECFGFQPDGSYSMRPLSVGYAEPLRSELVAFVDAVKSGEHPAVTGEEAVASLEIAIRCLDARAPQPAVARKGPRRVAG